MPAHLSTVSLGEILNLKPPLDVVSSACDLLKLVKQEWSEGWACEWWHFSQFQWEKCFKTNQSVYSTLFVFVQFKNWKVVSHSMLSSSKQLCISVPHWAIRLLSKPVFVVSWEQNLNRLTHDDLLKFTQVKFSLLKETKNFSLLKNLLELRDRPNLMFPWNNKTFLDNKKIPKWQSWYIFTERSQ